MKFRLKNIYGKKGDIYIDTLISIFIIMIFIVILIIILPVFIKKYHLDMFADQISAFVAVSGGTENLDISSLADEMGINLTDYSIEATDDAVKKYNTATHTMRIQLTGRYVVNVETVAYIGLGGVVDSIPVTLTSSAQGRSEVYWKDMETS